VAHETAAIEYGFYIAIIFAGEHRWRWWDLRGLLGRQRNGCAARRLASLLRGRDPRHRREQDYYQCRADEPLPHVTPDKILVAGFQ
jgi:hypothetical protein